MIRLTYETRHFDFEQELSAAQNPKRIVVHRQGNPGATALNALNWGKREDAFTVHSYVGGGVCYDAIHSTRHAFHVKEASVAAARGFRTTGAYGPRGDYDSIGIETEDVIGGAPGQAYSITQETRITLLLRVAKYLDTWNLTPEDVDEHATWDPVNRAEDLGDALHIPDFREDLRDFRAGRVPWRTVGQFARGTAAPLSWKPVEFDRVEARRLVQDIKASLRELEALIG